MKRRGVEAAMSRKVASSPILNVPYLLAAYHEAIEAAPLGCLSKTVIRDLGYIRPLSHFDSFWCDHLAATLEPVTMHSIYGEYTRYRRALPSPTEVRLP